VRRESIFFRRSKRQKFGELLIANGSITPEQLNDALKVQEDSGGLIGDILLERGHTNETEIVRALSTQYGLPVLRSNDYDIDKNLVAGFPAEFLYRNMVIPFDRIGDLTLVLTSDLPSDDVIATIERGGNTVVFYVSTQSDVQGALLRYKAVSDDERRLYLSLRRGLKRDTVDAAPPSESDELEVTVAMSESAGQDLSDAWSPTAPFDSSEGFGDSELLTDTGELDESDCMPARSAPGGAAKRPASASETDLLSEPDKSWESVFDAAEENLKKKPPK
jgi:hypothetical protein